MTSPVRILRMSFVLMGVIAAILSWSALTEMAAGLPDRMRLLTIDIFPRETGPVLLGRAELVQPPHGPTADRHLAVERVDGAIVAYDITSDRRLGYTGSETAYTDTSEVAVPQGAAILRIGDVTWKAERNGTRLQIQDGGDATGTRITLTPRDLRLQRGTLTVLTSVPWLDYAASFLRGHSLSYGIGGEVSDARIRTALEASQLPDRRLPLDAARLWYGENGWALARGRLPVSVETRLNSRDAEARMVPLVDDRGQVLVSSLTIGWTQYEVGYRDPDGPLRLTPVSRWSWINAEDVVPPPDDVPIVRKDTPPQKQLDPIDLERSGLLVLACAAAILVLTTIMKVQATRAVAVAGAGLALAVMPDGSLLTQFGRAIGVGFMAMGGFALVFGRFQSLRWRMSLVLLALLGTGLLAAVHMPAPLDPEYTGRSRETALAGTWLALSAPLLAPALNAATALFWALFVPVSTFAAVAGVRLAMLEPTESWILLLDRHLVALATIALLVSVLLGISNPDRSSMAERALLPVRRSFVWRTFIVAAGIVFVLVTLIGNETGFFGIFQPSEIAKSVLVLLVAFTLFRDLGRRSMLTAAEGALDLWTPLVAIAMASAILFASILNYDMSPILVSAGAILATLITGSTVHAAQLRRRRTARRFQGLPLARAPRRATRLSSASFGRVVRRELTLKSSLWPVVLVSVVCLVLGAVGVWIASHPNFQPGGAVTAESWLTTPWKRAQSWFDMVLAGGDGLINFPETGLQLRLAREALLEAHCSVVLALCPSGAPVTQGAEAVNALLRVPAIQDDFAAVSLVHALGIDGTLFYAGAQAGLVAAALGIGLTALFSQREFRLGAWLAGCATVGMAALVAMQMVLAWGNVLGFFPVMGQPMTFVSFGASHHLGVALPFAAMTIIAGIIAGPRLSTKNDVRLELSRQGMTQ